MHKLTNSWCNLIHSFTLTLPPPAPPAPTIPPQLLHHEIITFPWGEPSWATEEYETGRQAVLWESKGSFRSWYSQERLICHPCLKAICDCQKCVCVAGQGSWECEARVSFGGEGGIKKELWRSITALRHICPWDLLFSFSLLFSLSPAFSSSLSLSLTTKCSPTQGTWWLWWVHMKTRQWRYEALSSV